MSRAAELLLLPGMAQDERAYELAGLGHARTFVYPGHGDRAAVPVTLEGLADEAMVRASGPVDLVGVALGGIVGQHILARHGGRVRSAVLANTPGDVSAPAALHARAAATRADGPNAAELLPRWLRSATVTAGGPAIDYLREVLAGISWEGLAEVQAAMADHNAMDALRGDPHPVTFVIGEDDHVGIGATERLAEAFPTRRVVRIPGGHMVHLDNPRGFREAVEEHLAWVDALGDLGLGDPRHDDLGHDDPATRTPREEDGHDG
ncbi:alpha/beta fold hydrolase [Microbacterium rhizophilus]|uniref:alpha/beta fold hydrolase n=1 Tax=Microbacterium rhizophilus TaxID=3138934 RepID=UPI0031F186F3